MRQNKKYNKKNHKKYINKSYYINNFLHKINDNDDKFDENIKDNKFIFILKKILKYMIMIICLYLIIYFIIFCYYEFKVFRLNKTLVNDVNDVLFNLKKNLKETVSDILKLNNNKLLLSQIINFNEILKISSDKININIIEKKNGIIVDNENLGIYKYFNENNNIVKKINKFINIKNFFTTVEDKLKYKKYNTNYNSINLIENIYDFIYNIN